MPLSKNINDWLVGWWDPLKYIFKSRCDVDWFLRPIARLWGRWELDFCRSRDLDLAAICLIIKVLLSTMVISHMNGRSSQTSQLVEDSNSWDCSKCDYTRLWWPDMQQMHHCHHRCPHGRHPHNNYLQNWNVFSCFASLDSLTEAQPIQSLWLCPMDSRRSDKKKKSINRPTEYFQGRQHNTKQCWIFSYHLVCASLQKIYTNIKWGFWGDNYDNLFDDRWLQVWSWWSRGGR